MRSAIGERTQVRSPTTRKSCYESVTTSDKKNGKNFRIKKRKIQRKRKLIKSYDDYLEFFAFVGKFWSNRED